jgi:hypothetical protein
MIIKFSGRELCCIKVIPGTIRKAILRNLNAESDLFNLLIICLYKNKPNLISARKTNGSTIPDINEIMISALMKVCPL